MAAKSTKKGKLQSKKTATKKKNTTRSSAKRTSTTKKRSSGSKKKAQSHSQLTEVLSWLSIAIGIISFFSLLGLGGSFGDTISNLLKTNFGLCAYIIPFAFIFVMLMALNHNKQLQTTKRALLSTLLFVLVCIMMQFLFESGGLLGKNLNNILVSTIGGVGTFVFTTILIIICVVLITERSALQSMEQSGKKVMKSAKSSFDSQREEMQARKARRIERQRMEREDEEDDNPIITLTNPTKKTSKKTSGTTSKNRKQGTGNTPDLWNGVTFDTTLMDGKKKSPEIREFPSITLDPEPETTTSSLEASIPPATVKPVVEPVVTEVQSEPVSTPVPDPGRSVAAETTPSVKVKEAKAKSSKKTESTVEKTEDSIVADMKTSEADMNYRFPTLDFLTRGGNETGDSTASLIQTKMKLEETLHTFGVDADVTNYSQGPAVTRFEVQPKMGVKVSKIVNLADDINLNLAAADIRIEAPIPGKAAVGIEVPNKTNTAVNFGDLIASNEFKYSQSKLSFAVGKDLTGKTVVTDIAKMPHVLVAGATGSGKSVCINTLIMSILYKARPDEVKLIMVDPKVVELSVYNGIPHLLIPVVTDPKKAANALNWAVLEMEKRYREFARLGVRDMKGFNEKVKELEKNGGEEDTVKLKPMYQLVVIVDELADLMMVASKEVEASICRLAQLARAAGIHLVIATQRPSVNVITGLIKANMPSRIAFSVTSGVDSRTIIDMNGAEKLLGKGDMLFFPAGLPKPIRVQGSFVSDGEVERVVKFLKDNNTNQEFEDTSAVTEEIDSTAAPASLGLGPTTEDSSSDSEFDTYFIEAGRLIVDKEKASIGMLQRSFKIGFNRAARIMDQLCEAGVVGGEEGTKPRKILMNKDEFEEYVNSL